MKQQKVRFVLISCPRRRFRASAVSTAADVVQDGEWKRNLANFIPSKIVEDQHDYMRMFH